MTADTRDTYYFDITMEHDNETLWAENRYHAYCARWRCHGWGSTEEEAFARVFHEMSEYMSVESNRKTGGGYIDLATGKWTELPDEEKVRRWNESVLAGGWKSLEDWKRKDRY